MARTTKGTATGTNGDDKTELLKRISAVTKMVQTDDVEKINDVFYAIGKHARNKSIILKYALKEAKGTEKKIIEAVLAIRKLHVMNNPDKYQKR